MLAGLARGGLVAVTDLIAKRLAVATVLFPGCSFDRWQQGGEDQPMAAADDPGVVDLALPLVGRMLISRGLAAMVILGQKSGIGADGADGVVQVAAAQRTGIAAKDLGERYGRSWRPMAPHASNGQNHRKIRRKHCAARINFDGV